MKLPRTVPEDFFAAARLQRRWAERLLALSETHKRLCDNMRLRRWKRDHPYSRAKVWKHQTGVYEEEIRHHFRRTYRVNGETWAWYYATFSDDLYFRLAEKETIPQTETEVPVFSRSGHDYHTQGYGCNAYAKNAVLQRMDDYSQYVPCRIEEKLLSKATYAYQPTCRSPIPVPEVREYVLYARTDARGAALLPHKKGMDLREWVRLCWRRGVNPRVYNPYLPPGWEEKNGLDFFGNDLRKADHAVQARQTVPETASQPGPANPADGSAAGGNPEQHSQPAETGGTVPGVPAADHIHP